MATDTNTNHEKRGFAGIDKRMQKQIASKGGKS